MQAHVKIWFLSGGFERVEAESGRTPELATIYAEAEGNDRVVAAELHRADGSVAAQFAHDRAPGESFQTAELRRRTGLAPIT